MGYATLEQVKDLLKGVGLEVLGDAAEQDAQIQGAVEAASAQVDVLTGRTFIASAGTRAFDGPGTEVLVLPDLLSLSAWSEDGVSRPTSELLLGPPDGTPKTHARRVSGRFARGRANLRLTGVWGYAESVPAPVQRACALLAAAALLRRLGPARSRGTAATVQGSLSERYERGAYSFDEERYETEARALLWPYRRLRIR